MKSIGILTLGLLAAGMLHAGTDDVRAPRNIPAFELIEPDDLLRGDGRFTDPHPLIPGRDEVVGDTLRAGDTWYDYHSNGSVGKMIAFDDANGIHVTWMDLTVPNNDGERQQKYNFYNGEEWTYEDGIGAAPGTRSGFGNLVLSREDEQRALVFCHAVGVLQGPDPTTVMLVDFGRGFGAFESFQTPNYADRRIIWPMGVVSPSGIIHVAYNRQDAAYLSYTSADFNGGQPRFPDVPIQVSPMSLNTYRIAQSPNSERAAITYIKARTGIPAPAEWDGFLAYQINNDLWLAWTDDGDNWNFDDPLNVTSVIPTNRFYETPLSYGDTLRPYCTHDIIFDANDNIHIVFEARGLWEMAEYDAEVDRPPVDGLTIDASFLFHWTEEDCTMSPVADGWFSQQVRDENDSLLYWPTPGAWKSNVCNPSLAYADNGDLYCVYNYFPYGDHNDYVGVGGRCHGDVAVTVSTDNGRNWYYPTMLVETPTPLAEPGEAMSEMYPTIADKIDDNLHILFMVDREAGTTIQDADDNAANTLNPVFYLKTPVESVLRDSIWEGPSFHVDPLSVDNDPAYELTSFRLAGVYPNPFNSTARFEYDLKVRQTINLGLYSITGQWVADIYSGEALPGHHQVSFNAENLPAGIYIVKLSNSTSEASKKVALIR